MKYILSVKQVRDADNFAINELKIPSAILMENAARSSTDFIIKKITDLQCPNICIFCGSGNNGGDGFAIARHLFNNILNANIRVFLNGNTNKMSSETKCNYEILINMNIEIIHIEEALLEEYDFESDVIIDALIGVGGSENLKGNIVPLLEKINKINAMKFAIDIPTGLNADTGAYHKNSFNADYTISMFAEKTGMYLNNADEITGEIHTADLGAPMSIVENLSDIKIIEKNDIRQILKKRTNKSIKFDFGRVFVIAGSMDMPGAAALSSNATVRTGAGITYLITPHIHSSIFPEIITYRTSNEYLTIDDFDFIMEKVKKADAIAVGPGIGNKPETLELIRKIIFEIDDNIPLVVDADAIKALNKNDKLRKNIVLTPHIGEFAELLSKNRNEINDNALELAMEYAQKMNCIIHLKHFPSVTTDGKTSYWLESKNPGLSSGGSGDVLTGIIAGLIGQTKDTLLSSSLGAYLHHYAADLVTETIPFESLKGTDIIEGLAKVFK
jgi:hydroxyethylthiazole kinase-like uncharacterized protein yjeF